MRVIIDLLIYMSVAGSAWFGVYCVFGILAGNRWNAKSRYLFLKISLLFYTFPFPLLRYFIWNSIRPSVFHFHGNTKFFIQGHVNHFADGTYSFPIDLKWRMVLVVWGVSLGICFLTQIVKCYRFRKDVLIHLCDDEYDIQLTTELCREMNISRKVKVFHCNTDASPCTFGWFCPFIIMTDAVSEELIPLALKHELYHIKHNDFGIRMGFIAVRLLHCFNPLIYIFEREIKIVQELYVDECVTEASSLTEKRNYGNLLIRIAMTGYEDSPVLGFSMGNSCRKTLERRIRGMKKDRSISKWVFAVLFVVAMLVSSVPIFAYVPPANDLTTETDLTRKELREVDWIEYEYSDELQSSYVYGDEFWFKKVDSYIITEEGLVIPEINDGIGKIINATCHHQYANATKRVHQKSGKSCTVTSYSFKRCKKCGKQKGFKRISQTSYDVCPHT